MATNFEISFSKNWLKRKLKGSKMQKLALKIKNFAKPFRDKKNQITDAQINIQFFAKFFRYIIVKGDFQGTSKLLSLNIQGLKGANCVSQIQQDILSDKTKFELHILRNNDDPVPEECHIEFTCASGAISKLSYHESYSSHYLASPNTRLHTRFLDELKKIPRCKLLELGGRSRSGVDTTKSLYKSFSTTVVDICPGDNVDYVGDAHELSSILEASTFDAITSISVFEHLAMPWKVVLSMNHVLRPGGLAYIQSHQTVGMHDIQWDFWRFSDSAWEALFNKKTGFEIIETAMSYPQFIIPHHYWPSAVDAEKTAGFLASAVLVRKISECNELDWPISIKDITETQYPHN